MQGDAPPILELRGLTRDFVSGGVVGSKTVRALEAIDLRVSAGETLGIVGESGSGKTTLARCATFLLEPTAGRVFFDGADLTRMDRRQLRSRRREFQIIFQDPLASIDPRMTVRRIVSEPFVTHGLGRKEERDGWVRALLDQVSLDPALLDRYPSELSGGQQQRVVIARALALKPRLLIADEPVASLDASVQAQILNLLVDLRRLLGLTLVLISHSLPVVRYLCHRVVVLYRGRIAEEAPAGSFFQHPRHPYSQLLLASAGKRRYEEKAPTEEPLGVMAPSGCPFHPRCPHVIPVCRSDPPDLTELGPENKVACFLYTNPVRSA